MEIKLHDIDWQLKGFWPWVPLKGTSMEIGQTLMGVTDWIPATVPGGVHEDLFQAGFIQHPHYDMNSLHCEWVENRWWVYKGCFTMPALDGDKVELVFKGLDYEALIYWNETLLGEHKGMYHAAKFDVTNAIEGNREVELLVVLKHAPDEMGQIGKTSETFTQKSRFNYKWDFSTRLVNIGIWDEVVLEVNRSASFKDCYVHTDVDLERNKGLVNVSVEVEGLDGAFAKSGEVEISLLDPHGNLLERTMTAFDALHPCTRLLFEVDAPELWYPNGYGAQPLYEMGIVLLLEGKAVAEKRICTGIRKLEYARNEGSPEQALPYTVVINGVSIYIKGVNITPLDHLYGNVDRARYDWLVYLAKSANINLIRVWGGGIIEKTYFYELCDRYGLLVWQEFIQSSSGIDNEPSKHPQFLRLLRTSAIEALRQRRNHVCLTVWSGGNELMSEANKPSTYEDENLAMLKELVSLYDSRRLFLPTSASGPVQYITEEKGLSHDVHGHWKYMGNPYHYELYGNVDHLFHSEFGVDGVSSLKSLQKFLGAAHLKPQSMEDSIVWRHHGEWWDTFERDELLFGKLEHMEMFVRCSQWIQAEGLRFILEANRRRAFHNSGSIIWQMNEPWPNVSCTNLVDYYQETKMAYHWAKKAFAMKHVSLAYRKLNYCVGERFAEVVYVHSDDCHNYKLVAQVLNSQGKILHEQVFAGEAAANRAVKAGVLSFDVPSVERELFIVKLRLQLEYEAADQAEVTNMYYFSTADSRLYASALQWTGAELVVQPQGSWHHKLLHADLELWERAYVISNEGTEAALHIYAEELSDQYWLAAEGTYETIFPGEQITVVISCAVRQGELFRTSDAGDTTIVRSEPIIAFSHFTK